MAPLKFARNLLRKVGTLSRIPRRNIYQSLRSKSDEILNASEEVLEAIQSGKPVVALESAIITHGLPYPENLRIAKEVEDVVRQNGSIPATIGIVDGRIYAGLSEDDLEVLSKHEKPIKISRRDIPFVASQKMTGGTTVSATMLIANRVGIPIFVTGGIGGVHRHGEATLDISADLIELGRTPITVISAGVKSILDIEKTLEYLETQGVCVTTFGSTKDFPAFFTPKSGLQVASNVETPQAAAKLILSRDKLEMESGILIAVPIPEQHESDSKAIEEAIQKAVTEAEVYKIHGKDVTPFLLKRVNELTGGKSLAANRALILNNAKTGSQISAELAKLNITKSSPAGGQGSFGGGRGAMKQTFSSFATNNFHLHVRHYSTSRRPVVIGGSVVDIVITMKDDLELNGSTHRGTIRTSYGGVGRNLADCLTRLGHSPLFISAVGQDVHAHSLLAHNPLMDTSAVRQVKEKPTAVCAVVLDKWGEHLFEIGDMSIHGDISISQVSQYKDMIKNASLVIFDGNLPQKTMEGILQLCMNHQVPVWFEPTDVNVAAKPFTTPLWQGITYSSPNLRELRVMHNALSGQTNKFQHTHTKNTNETLEMQIDEIAILTKPLLQYMHTIFVTVGPSGVILATKLSQGELFPIAPLHNCNEINSIKIVHYPSKPAPKIVSVSGAGDCLAGGIISGMMHSKTLKQCLAAGIHAAVCSLASYQPVPGNISSEILFDIPKDQIDIKLAEVKQ